MAPTEIYQELLLDEAREKEVVLAVEQKLQDFIREMSPNNFSVETETFLEDEGIRVIVSLVANPPLPPNNIEKATIDALAQRGIRCHLISVDARAGKRSFHILDGLVTFEGNFVSTYQ